MKTELVSVVIATYRRDTSLLRALESVSSQTYVHYEIVIVDDNADPVWNAKVASLVSQFQTRYPHIAVTLICNKENLGSAQARNVGIHASSGNYICFLDDDDIYLEDRIEHQLAAMKASGADFSVTDLKLYNHQEKLVDHRKRDYIQDQSQLMKYHLMYHLTGTDTLMFQKQYLLQIGCFDPINIGDEFYLIAKAIRHGGKFQYVPGCHVKAYVHSEGAGLSSGSEKIDGENRLYAYKKQFFGELDRKTVRYIRMRHHAVLANVGLRNRNYGRFLAEGLMAVGSAPLAAAGILLGRY